MRKAFRIFAALGLAFLLLCACANTEEPVPTAAPLPTAPTAATTAAPALTEPAPTAAPETTAAAAAPEQTEPYNLTLPEGDYTTLFTDDPNNKFIRAVSEKYGVDASLLACAYTEPVSDSNQVWQFSGKTDAAGKLRRSASTLKYVYMVTDDCKTIQRTGGLTGNDGYSAAAGFVVFQTAKQLVLPQFEAQLNA